VQFPSPGDSDQALALEVWATIKICSMNKMPKAWQQPDLAASAWLKVKLKICFEVGEKRIYGTYTTRCQTEKGANGFKKRTRQ